MTSMTSMTSKPPGKAPSMASMTSKPPGKAPSMTSKVPTKPPSKADTCLQGILPLSPVTVVHNTQSHTKAHRQEP
eukprot:1160027-Pelagomonas_calceolata.AAC.5